MRLTIDVVPVPKGRPRFTRSGHVYTPKRTRDFERLVGWTYRAHGGKVHAGPVYVWIDFYVARESDIDNLVKAILDGLTGPPTRNGIPRKGIAWNDDRQVKQLRADVFASRDPRIEIEIGDLDRPSLSAIPKR